MNSLNVSRIVAAVGIVAAVAACAGPEANLTERTTAVQASPDRTAVSQAATGAIVGCASNAAIHEQTQPQRRPLSPLCSRKS